MFIPKYAVAAFPGAAMNIRKRRAEWQASGLRTAGFDSAYRALLLSKQTGILFVG